MLNVDNCCNILLNYQQKSDSKLSNCLKILSSTEWFIYSLGLRNHFFPVEWIIINTTCLGTVGSVT